MIYVLFFFLVLRLASNARSQSAVTSIDYDINFTGSYKRVSFMDGATGECEFSTASCSGPLAPIDDEISFHLRGPIELTNFAAFSLKGHNLKKREVIEEVEVETIIEYTTVFQYKEQPTPAAVNPPKSNSPEESKKPEEPKKPKEESSDQHADPPANTPSPENQQPQTTPTADDAIKPSATPEANNDQTNQSETQDDTPKFVRTSSYDAASQSTDNLIFMNNKGNPALSGTFTYTFGNSLSFASSDAVSCAASPQTLANGVVVGSDQEFILFSGQACQGNNMDCGYFQPGIPAYHGFKTKDSLFVFKFKMPSDGNSGNNGDLPAIWALNALIPRTAEYHSCSCWGDGCGEFDIWEAIPANKGQLISHLHSKQGATNGGKGGYGSPNFFPRPYDHYMIGGVYFSSSGSVKIVDLTNKGFDFASTSLPKDFVDSL